MLVVQKCGSSDGTHWQCSSVALVPAVRTLISVPAGMVAMSPSKLLSWSFAGPLLWSGLFAGAGFYLGDRFEDATRRLDLATKEILACVVAAYVRRIVNLPIPGLDPTALPSQPRRPHGNTNP